MDETLKYKTCIHSTGRAGEIAVYVLPSCPRMSLIRGTLVSSKTRCKECRSYKPRKEYKDGRREGHKKDM